MNAEELLAHNSFLVDLARKLVRDEQSADDVAQQTYVAALEHPPADERPLAPWLAAVARNFARMSFRSARRRGAREEAAAMAEGIPSAADIVAQEEIRAKVVDAVLGLDEPFRDVVVLRFYQGLGNQEVAQRLGVPLETMRSRLKKALALLARRLDALHDGERKNWLAALGPIAGLKVAGASTGAASLWAALGALSLKIKIGAAALIVLGTAFWIVSSIEPEGVAVDYVFAPLSEDRPADDVLALSDPDSGSDRLPLEARGDETGGAAVAETIEATLAGRLVDTDGLALSGVAIGDPQGDRTASSGSAGRFEIVFPLHSSRKSGRKTVTFAKERFASLQLEAVVRAHETVHLGDVVLAPGGALSGRVVDPLGNPIAGAVVVCADTELLPDEDGRRRMRGPFRRHQFIDEAPPTNSEGAFRYSGAPAGWVRLWARAEGTLFTYTRPVEVRAGQETQGIELILEPIGHDALIAGVVVDPDGRPLPHARVRCFHRTLGGSGSSSFTADKEGRFSRELSRKTAHTFEASDSEHRFCSVRAEKVAPGTLDLVLRLKPLRTFTVAVRTSGESVLEKAVVHVKSTDRIPNTDSFTIPARPTADEFLLDVPLPAAEFTLHVEAVRFQTAGAGPFSPESIPDPVKVTLAAIPGIDGQVLAGGNPVAGAYVWQYGASPPDRAITVSGFACHVNPDPVDVTTTDEEGRFYLAAREAGTFYLHVRADGFAAAELGPLVIDPEVGLDDVVIAVDQGGSLEGRVWMAEGKDPTGVVVALSRGDAFPRSVRVGADGVYRFDRLTPGGYEIEKRDEEIVGSSYSIRRNRKAPRIAPVCVVEAGRTTFHDLELGGRMACALAGRLSLDGAAPAGWKACLVPDRAEEIDSPGIGLDLHGSFRLDALTPGACRLLLKGRLDDGPEIEIRDRIELAPGENAWARDFALATLRIEGAAPLPDEWTFYGYRWTGPGALEVVVILGTPDRRKPFVCHVPAGIGSIVRIRKPRQGTEKHSDEILLDVDMTPGDTITVRLQ